MNFKKIKELKIIHTGFAITMFFSGLSINIVQLILYVGLKPFNKELYRRINYYLAYSLYSQLVFLNAWWGGGEIHVYLDKEAYAQFYGKEHAFLIMNHSYEIDWLIGYQFCENIGVLGNCKAFSKKVLQYIPIFGWMWKFSEYIFLERNFEKDKAIINQQIKEMGDYPDPVWLMLYPESTRFSDKKHEISQKFAREKGLSILNHHLNPRTKGFTTCMQGIDSDKFPAIYNIQLAFDRSSKVEPTMTSLFYGKKISAHLYINRLPLEDIPRGEKESAEWLCNLFDVKDRMQTSFHKTGDFFKESGVKRVDHFLQPRRIYPLLNMVFWNTVVLVPLFTWLFGLLFSGELLLFCILTGVLAIFYFLMQFMIGRTKISKSSSFGQEKKNR